MKIDTAVLLPGLDGTGDLFEPFVEAAPRGLRTVVVDYPTNESSIDVLERRANQMLTERTILIAESFSGPIGVRVARDPRVQALVLCNSFIRSPHHPFFRHLALAPLFAIPIEFALSKVSWAARPALPCSEKRNTRFDVCRRECWRVEPVRHSGRTRSRQSGL